MSPTILRMLRELRRDTDRKGARPLAYYLQARRRPRGGGVGTRGSLSHPR